MKKTLVAVTTPMQKVDTTVCSSTLKTPMICKKLKSQYVQYNVQYDRSPSHPTRESINIFPSKQKVLLPPGDPQTEWFGQTNKRGHEGVGIQGDSLGANSHIKLSAFRGNPPVSLATPVSLLAGFPEWFSCNLASQWGYSGAEPLTAPRHPVQGASPGPA